MDGEDGWWPDDKLARLRGQRIRGRTFSLLSQRQDSMAQPGPRAESEHELRTICRA